MYEVRLRNIFVPALVSAALLSAPRFVRLISTQNQRPHSVCTYDIDGSILYSGDNPINYRNGVGSTIKINRESKAFPYFSRHCTAIR